MDLTRLWLWELIMIFIPTCLIIRTNLIFLLYHPCRSVDPDILSLLPGRMGCRAGPGPVRTWCRPLPARDLCHRLVFLCCRGLHRGYFSLGCALGTGRDRNIQWWCPGWDLKRKVHYMSTMMIYNRMSTKREPKPATGWYPQKKVHRSSIMIWSKNSSKTKCWCFFIVKIIFVLLLLL